MEKKNKLWGVDIFSGAGGLSIGAEMAGIETVVAVENDIHASETYKFNHKNAIVICDDIRNVKLEDKFKNPFVLFGGPPCQGFSTSNTKTRNSNNQNNSLFYEYIRQVKELSPDWFVFENVEGITSFEKGTVVNKLKELFKELGYDTTHQVLVASDYGVPQNRNRFFMVGNKLGVNFEFPEKNERKVTVKEALEDLPDLYNGSSVEKTAYKKPATSSYAKIMRGNSKYATQNFVSRNQDYVLERYRHIKPGQNWKAIPDKLMENYKNSSNCHSGIYKRLDPEKPSVVIANYRKNMLIHPFQDRGLSVREAARIQSFPDSFIFKGNLSFQQQQIGNAVPPLLAKAIFEQIIRFSSKDF